MKAKVSKMAMLLLVLCMTISMFSVNVSAEDATTPIDSCDRIVEPYDLDDAEDYINDGKNSTYPTCKTEGYLFAGWYTKETCTEDSYWGNEEQGKPGDTVYALFVPSHVLSVKTQISGNLLDKDTNDDTTASIRFVTTVDSLYYRQAGFEVSYIGTDGKTKSVRSASNKVYQKLYAIGSTSDEYTEQDILKYTPQGSFCTLSEYFKACTVKNIGSDYFGTAFTVKPYVITMDGSKVYGETVVKSISDYFSAKDLAENVWVSSTDENSADTVLNGSEEKPFKTLNYALGMVQNHGTIHVKGTHTAPSNFAWRDHDKTVTITGGTVDFAALSDLYINDGVTFTSINLIFPAASETNNRVFAEGNKLIIKEDANITNKVQLFGGSHSVAVESTHLEVYAGTYSAIFGGSDARNVSGDTNVIVGGTVNEGITATAHSKAHLLFGAGWKGTVYGDTNVEVQSGAKFNYIFGGGDDAASAVKGSTNVKFAGEAMSIYGGSVAGSNGDTHVVMTGGYVEQIFGGCENASMTGNTNVQVLGGTVKRRVYGGCYNDAEGTLSLTWSSTPRKVTGHTNVSIGPDATFLLDYKDPDYNVNVDNSIYSISRYKTTLDQEWGAFIFNANSYDQRYETLLGYNDPLHSGYFAIQSYHYLITTNGNTTDGSYGTVSPENGYIRIEPKSGYSATVTVEGTQEYYTESNAVFKLPELTNKTDKRNIVVTFGTIDPSVDKSDYEAKIDGAYYDTLEEAVDAAQTQETEDVITVTLLKDAEVEETMAITDASNVAVEGADKYTINRADSMKDESIFTIEDGSTLTVDNVVLDGRTTTDIDSNTTDLDSLEGSESSLIYNDGTVCLQNITAQYAVKTEANGAVLQSWGKDDIVIVDNSTFSYNKAPGQGAAIRMGGGTAKLEVSDSTFEYNKVYTLTTTTETETKTVTGLGGAIGTHAVTTNIDNCKFVGNAATGDAEKKDACAGAIYSGTNSVVTMTGSDENALFSGNSVTNGHGGAVTAGSGKVTITGYTFTTNTSTGNGGAILSQGKTTKIKSVSCTFEENTATGNGGVAYAAGSGTLIFDVDANCAVEALAKDNEAGASGGVTAQGSNTVVKVTGYKFEGNSAQYGGAIRVNADARSATIKNTEFVSNTATQPGGAIQSYSLLSVTGSTFTGNTSGNAGGAIHNVGNDSSINDCTFTGNISATNGGAVCTDTAITVNSSTFTGNEANKNSVKTNGGGAIFTGNNIVITIEKCAFNANKSVGAEDSFGGAIYMKKGTLKMDSANGTTFTSNTATHGGAIYMTTGTATINNSEFDLNESVWPGGAIYSNGSLSVTGSSFEENESTRGIGGAVKLDGSASGKFEDIDFMENHAGNAGGAIHNAGNNITIHTCTFTNNTSVNGGGAINTDKAMTIIDSAFTSNASTKGNGGAFYNGKNVAQTITGCDFVSDSAVSGGAIYLNDGTMTATDCEFYGNTSTKEGGAVWTNASTTTIKNSIFGDTDRGNSTATNGGALYIAETKTVNVDNTTFKANTAVNGGAIECHNSTLKATSCQFIENEATTDDVAGFVGRGGGAVNITGNARATFDGTGTFESNTAATGHGGAIYTTDAELSITGYTFTSNSASRAGAIMIDNVTEVVIEDDESTKDVDETEYDELCTKEIIINDSKFVQNHSDEHGGAIYTKTRTLKLTKASADALFDRNTSDSLGGAVCSNGSPIIVQGYKFDTNSASEGGAIWSNNALTVNDSTFNANTSTGIGGAIEHSGATGRIEGTTFSNNTAGNAGGAIINKGTNTSVIDCTFTSNTTATNGGAICTDKAITITGTEFTSNKAGGGNDKYGGAIYTGQNIQITIDDCGFTSNSATHGGAIYMATGTGIITASEFKLNESVWHGGTIFANGSLNVTGTTFDGNKTTSGIAGAIRVESKGTGTFQNCQFLNNQSGNAGGAIHNAGANTTVTACIFTSNTAKNNGGAICSDTAITIADTTFTSNQAKGTSNKGGGALYTDKNVVITIENCDFASNKASGGTDSLGGAVYMTQGTLNITSAEGTTFTSNTATHGGAIYMKTGTATINNSEFKLNESVWPGGGIYSNGTLNVTGSLFESNKAGNAGGAIKLDGNAYGTITACDFKMNKANHGGAIHEQGKSISLKECLFESNQALNGKGGAFNGQQNTKTIDACTFTGNTATGDGKAVYFEKGGTLNLKNSIFNNYNAADIVCVTPATLQEDNNTKN